jgi:hypothetical protein
VSSSLTWNPFIKLRPALPERFLSPAVSCVSIAEEAHMAFNTTSFLAGVGSMVAVISTGLAGGYFLASPSHIDPPNRLQRVAAANQDSKPVPVTTDAKPEVVAAAAPIAAPAPTTGEVAQTPAPAPVAPAAQPAVASPEAKASEPARTAAVQETAATAKPDTGVKPNDAKTNDAKTNGEKANADKARSAEARAVEKKRAETTRITEQQRKQRELEVAAMAVRRIIHERDASDVVVDSDPAETPAAEMPHFNLFRQ